MREFINIIENASGSTIKPTFVVDNDEGVPHSKWAVFGDDEIDEPANMVYWASDKYIVLQVISATKEIRGRDMLQWLSSTYRKPILVVDVVPKAISYWEQMKREGLIADWTRNEFKGRPKPISENAGGDGTLYHVTPKKNLRKIKATGLIPQSGPRSKQMNDHGIYLFKSEIDAEDAVMNWLGDEFGEDVELVLLAVQLPKDAHITTEAFEIVCHTPIPPENISLVGEL